MPSFLDKVNWNEDGLVPVVAQDVESGRLLMQAWANRESLQASIEEGRAVYWSRSRSRLWRKGEESGNVQKLVDVYMDCDNDTLCFKVQQIGGIACHTGRESCFFQKLENGEWKASEPVLKDPAEMYGNS
ncbi:MAG: phosphoribosyl-AMP cyclohydrolase [Pseudomonadota bacterium]|nr:phosphoribosyl-AMP cyclohydrolase [Pseudomonadota bacterium]GIT22795.1 MAG: phosphoribosyl-AMP cyclohydrolase [Gammaproteobacteria bacterium]|tara:strand:- start:125 stop:514 length:390 start_codon:yes stop_codon:yes gene_type:complete